MKILLLELFCLCLMVPLFSQQKDLSFDASRWENTLEANSPPVVMTAKAESIARVSQNAALALRTVHSNATVALQIAGYNLIKHPGDPVATTAFHDIISNPENIFYKNEFSSHDGEVTSVAFSADGKSILMGSGDGTAKLWLSPQDFLKQTVKAFTLQELYNAGVKLEPEDLKKIK